eukprot:TRINITY_DN14218_c0_g1_i1.p1 TRINITY_DN14218_c0_g1~~TRINITY_DN14218_c0_g1_i1.p1  ORF type:complete len:158 (-),score=28.60 TRINITY_DN14218_c0_g1_i1:73-546(-)
MTGRLESKILPKEQQNKSWNVIKGDLVQVMWGTDKGKIGKVMKVLRKRNRVIVEGAKLVKKHVKGTADFKGGIFTKESSIPVSNVHLVDPSTGQPTKVSRRYLEDGSKVRVARSGTIIPKPVRDYLKDKDKKRAAIQDGSKDTPPSVAIQKTYVDVD